MVERGGRLSVRRQSELLGLSRSSLYYTPRGASAGDMALMRRLDELYLEHPFYGSRQMVRHLRREGTAVGRHRVRRLMRVMGLEALYRKPRTSVSHPDHRVYPYLLRGVKVERPDHVWCADLTYIPVSQGYLYLVAVMDWASRHVLSWRVSNTMDSQSCIQALEAALRLRHAARSATPTKGRSSRPWRSPNTFSRAVVSQCSMDGRGRCLDNVFIVRLWRSLKYDAVYLHELCDGFEAERVIASWMRFYTQ